MFLGEYKVNFSGHGRLILPKKFREQLDKSDEVILSRGLDGCIWGFDKKGWAKETKEQLSRSLNEKEVRDMRRYLFSAAEIVRLDNQGRFVTPNALLKYAGLESEAIVIGAGDHFEIWNPKNWDKLISAISKEAGEK